MSLENSLFIFIHQVNYIVVDEALDREIHQIFED